MRTLYDCWRTYNNCSVYFSCCVNRVSMCSRRTSDYVIPVGGVCKCLWSLGFWLISVTRNFSISLLIDSFVSFYFDFVKCWERLQPSKKTNSSVKHLFQLTFYIIGTLKKLWLNMFQRFVLHRENICVLISDFSEAWKTLVLNFRN